MSDQNIDMPILTLYLEPVMYGNNMAKFRTIFIFSYFKEL